VTVTLASERSQWSPLLVAVFGTATRFLPPQLSSLRRVAKIFTLSSVSAN
jgi:hypothetical protein